MLKTTSAGVQFCYTFRKEPFSFIENKLLHSFLVFSDFFRMKSEKFIFKAISLCLATFIFRNDYNASSDTVFLLY